MYTRIIEHPGCKHNSVDEIRLRKRSGKSILFDAFGDIRVKGLDSSGYDMDNEKETINSISVKTLQIDIERNNIFRIRFSESLEIPDNNTPMLIPEFFQADTAYDFIELEEAFHIKTKDYLIKISKKPYSLSIFDKNENKKLSASIGEANNFKPMDSYNIGVVRGGGKLKLPFFPVSQKNVQPNINNNIPIAVESFELKTDEHIYGFGENFTGLSKKYQTIDLWTQDALGPTSQRTYKPVPFFVSSRGYGIYINSHAPITAWIGSLSNIRTVIAVENNFVDYFMILGENMKEVISAYTDITGPCSLPPKWSFGFWLSKFTYHSDAETTEIVKEMRARKLPFDVLHLDTHWFEKDWICDLEFSKINFPNVESYLKRMKENGVHISLWQMPYLQSENNLYKEATEKGFFPTKNGKPAFHENTIGVLDVSNPNMIEWWKEKFRKLFSMGVSVIKTDFGEGALTECAYFNGMEGRAFHNLYPFLYVKAIFEVAAEFSDQPFIWGRSAWAGSQRFPLFWGGDNSGYFEQIIPQLTGGLSLMMSGFPFWSQDIGGFNSNVTDIELYIRWFQLGLFMSHPRLHGLGEREPFRFGKEVESQIQILLNLRYSLIPYIYSCAYESVKSGVPFIRTLPLEFENDPNLMNIADQFMFGPSLMVAPIVESGGKRKLYFPKGEWIDFFTNEIVKGEQWIKGQWDINHFPLYAKSGSIIVMGPEMQYVGEKSCDPLSIHLYTGCETQFEYFDDHESFIIELMKQGLKISYIKAHNLVIYVHTLEQITQLFVNCESYKFDKTENGFSFEYCTRETNFQALWQ